MERLRKEERRLTERRAELRAEMTDGATEDGRRPGLDGELRRIDGEIARHASAEWRRARWDERLRGAGFRGSIPPRARDNKARIIAWMTYFPASMAWTLVNDPIRHAIEFLYNRVGKLLQSMSDRTFRGVENACDDRD